MTDSVQVRLRRLAECLPPSGSVLLTRDDLLELAAMDGDHGRGGDLTVTQAAERLGCSTSHVRRLLEAHALDGYKLAGGPRSPWRVPPAALARLRTHGRDASNHRHTAADLSAWRRFRSGEPA